MAKKSEPQASDEGLKFIHLELQNFKNIDKKVIDIGGRSIMLLGRNGSGKSSLIQALMSPLDTKVIPTEPIKKGEERATISVKIAGHLGDGHKEYVLDSYFTPQNGKGRLVVTNEKGETVKSPATFVKSLIGNVSLDPMKWLSDPKAKRLETIKNLTGCGKAIDIINIEIRKKSEDKKFKKQRAEELEAIMKNHEYSKEEIDRYSKPVDTSVLQQELAGIAGNQQKWDTVNNRVNTFKQAVNNSTAAIERAYQEIEKLKKAIEYQEQIITVESAENSKNLDNIQKGEAWLANTPRPTIDAVNARMGEAIKHNENCNRISRLAEQNREMLNAKREVDTILTEIESLEKDRSDLISKSQLPIQGFTFTDDEMFLDGIPMEEGQINSARLIDVGVDIAMALNPNLKVIFLHDGSLFDRDSLRAIVNKIEAKGYQAIIEMVDYEGGDLEVKFTEEELK